MFLSGVILNNFIALKMFMHQWNCVINVVVCIKTDKTWCVKIYWIYFVSMCFQSSHDHWFSFLFFFSSFVACRKLRNKRKIRVPSVSNKLADIPPDDYSWRKYGQKPIKGSPYPRYANFLDFSPSLFQKSSKVGNQLLIVMTCTSTFWRLTSSLTSVQLT